MLIEVIFITLLPSARLLRNNGGGERRDRCENATLFYTFDGLFHRADNSDC